MHTMMMAQPANQHEAIDLSLIKKEINDVPRLNGDTSNDEKALLAAMFDQQVLFVSSFLMKLNS